MLAQIKFNKKTDLIMKVTIVVLIIIIAVLTIITVIYYRNFGMPIVDKSNISSYVKKIAQVPENENPVIAQIVDPQTLQNQNPTVFHNVEKDDYILVYSTRAVIFRGGSENRIVDIINLNSNNKINLQQ